MTHQVEAKPEVRMAENITIKVRGKHQQTGEYGANEFKGQHIDIDELAMPFLIHGRAWVPRSPTSQVATASRRSTGGRIRFAAGATPCHARYQSDNRLCSLQRNSLHLERSFTSSIRGQRAQRRPLASKEEPSYHQDEVHRYAPELNRLHLCKRHVLPAHRIAPIK